MQIDYREIFDPWIKGKMKAYERMLRGIWWTENN